MRNGPNQLSEVHGDGSRRPVMVGAEDSQAKEEASGECEETGVSGERGETEGTHQR